jgi:predicted dehydrogenase
MTPEQREIGKGNFHRAVGQLAADAEKPGVTRRQFMKGLLAAGAVLPVSAAAYFGYQWGEVKNKKPVKAALIGAGDEGGVLVGAHNPEYLEFVAVCDLRPTNKERIFTGDMEMDPTAGIKVWKGNDRKGFEHIPHYGKNARKMIEVFDDYKKMLDESDRLGIEAVVIALPLHLHAPVAIDCLKAKKHVLCEKLMAWNINQCKEMIRVAKENDRILTIGHQRHYSMLYAHALEVLQSGVLGDIRHIRALWHRNNAKAFQRDPEGNPVEDSATHRLYKDSWCPVIEKEDRDALEKMIRALGYRNMEELVRWRLYKRTGGGLMAELGSHQLDACSIFLGKVHPLAVTGVGGKYFYHDDREVEDHVFCTFEFPGKNYWADKQRTKVKEKDDKVIVTYSSISTNGFEPYGECVMGSRGTMIVQSEQTVMLYPEPDAGSGRSVIVGVSTAGGGKPALEASASGGPLASQASSVGQQALGSGPVSRGYREEIEHFAYCIRMWQDKDVEPAKRPLTRCHGKVAMADAIIALTSNQAMKNAAMNKPPRIEFDSKWFDPDTKDVPDADMVPETV